MFTGRRWLSRGLLGRLALLGLLVRLVLRQPLLLGRQVLFLMLELRALLTVVLAAPLRLILFCVTGLRGLLERLGPLALRAPRAPRALRALRVLMALMALMAPMVKVF
jgi:hypothetical protein